MLYPVLKYQKIKLEQTGNGYSRRSLAVYTMVADPHFFWLEMWIRIRIVLRRRQMRMRIFSSEKYGRIRQTAAQNTINSLAYPVAVLGVHLEEVGAHEGEDGHTEKMHNKSIV